MTANTQWPGDVDGDVLRIFQEGGHDFEEVMKIDFMVDFDAWPPAPAFVEQLATVHQGVEVFEPEGDDDGYVQFVVTAKLSYELVMSVQAEVTRMARPFGGVCEAWGAFSNAPVADTDDTEP
jgi:hypothetical protein